MTTFIDNAFNFDIQHPSLGLIALPGALEFSKAVDKYLVSWFNEEAERQGKPYRKNTFLINTTFPRFSSGEGKALITESVRGLDIYVLCDICNYSIKFNMFGMQVPMTPDDYYADLKRVIGAVGGKAANISIVMPLLYGGRQHRRTARESLDCAMMLQDLADMGVKEFITFDAHDPRVQNAIPLIGFDNFMPPYQMMKALLNRCDDISLDSDNFMVVSPDEGAMDRNIYYASVLGVNLGMFYKRRDYSTVVGGRNPIVAHEYIGVSVKGLDVLVVDDIIATGESMISIAEKLKAMGAKRVFIAATFGLFTAGIEKFRKAYEEGLISAVISTNLTYTIPELFDEPWYISADMSKFTAYIISACNQQNSVSKLLDPHDKICELIDKHKKK